MKYLLMVCLMTMSAVSGFAAEQTEAFTAKLFTAKGTVEYLKNGTAAWVAVKAPYMLEVGDQVKTGPKSKAEIYIKYGAKVRLGAETTFVISKVSPQENGVEVIRGKMQAWIRKFAGRGFSVRTPSAVCAVRGTVFEVEVAESGHTAWNLFSGSLQIADNRSRSVDLAPGQRLEVTQAEGAAAPVLLPPTIETPSEPKTIAEEKVEIKAEQVIIEAAKPAEQKAEEAAPVEEPVVALVEEPVTTVITTQEIVQAVCDVSSSSPDCN